MQLANSKTRYGAGPQLLHWLAALFIAVGWLIGQFGDGLPEGAARSAVIFAHITLGLCVLVLLAARLIWRLADPPPPPEPTRFGVVAERLAGLSHIALYTLMLAVPAVGIVLVFARGHELSIFGLWHIASPWPADRIFARKVIGVHEVLANALVILAGLHAAAALWHHFALRDRTLVRMLPGAG